jgi:hypothetical protein
MPSACERIFSVLIATIAVMAGATGFAQAGLIIYVEDVNNNLGVVDATTGVVSKVVAIKGTSGDTVTDIAFNASGVLYGVTGPGAHSNLYTINITTGQATLVGGIGASEINALTFGSDGSLYAASANTTNIYKLNLNNGNGTDLGSDGFVSSGDLAFNNGSLYLTANGPRSDIDLIKINLTGNSVSGGTNLGVVGYPVVHGLVTGSDGVLYGASNTDIISINPQSGMGTFVSDYTNNTLGLGDARGATTMPESVVVPVPGNIALLFSGSLALALYHWFRRRGLSLACSKA